MWRCSSLRFEFYVLTDVYNAEVYYVLVEVYERVIWERLT